MSSTEHSQQSFRVLIVEDNPGDADLIALYIEEANDYHYELTQAASLLEARAALDSKRFDLAILDLSLPDSSGLDTLRACQTDHPEVEFIVLSGSSAADLRSQAIALGAQDFVGKNDPPYRALMRSVLYAIERRRVQQQQQQLHQLVTANPDAVIVIDVEGRVRFVNQAALELFGRSRAEFEGELLGFAVPEGQHTEIEILRGGERRVAEVRQVPIEWAGRPAFLATIHDRTEEARAKQQALAYARRQELMADAARAFAEASLDEQAVLDLAAQQLGAATEASCAIYLLDEHGAGIRAGAMFEPDPEIIALTNGVAPVLSMLTDTHLPTRRVLASGEPLIVPDDEVAQFSRRAESAVHDLIHRLDLRSVMIIPLLMQRRPIGLAYMGRRGPGARPFTNDELQLAADLAGRAAFAASNARLFERMQSELTERQRAEAELEQERAALAQRVEERTAELRRANAELARAARLKDEFLANMSHELRTPLNTVLGRAGILLEGIYDPLTPAQERAIQGIDESGRHLLALINDILDLSKIEAGKLELEIAPIAVESLCAQSLRLVAQIALKKRIGLSSNIDSAVPMLVADERRLKQILVNLLSNAVKFTPEGGQVGLEVRGDAQGRLITFSVWDTGIGIAAADLAKLFQPFVQIDSSLSRRYEGTGLGLALVDRLARAHGGAVAVESAPGQGSRFSVTLPWRTSYTPPDDEDMLPAPAPARKPAAAPHARILLVDDNPANSEFVVQLLEAHGYELSLAGDGAEALQKARDEHPDLILMDIQMPGMDGLEATRRIRAESHIPHMPIIALTALAMRGDRERCLAAGADGYLSKPIDLEQLLAMVSAYLHQARSEDV